MGPINKEEQYNKMKTAHTAMSQWISHKKENLYNEEAYDPHPFRPILHVKSHQLERGTRVPTGRLKKLTPNETVVTMNQQVDEVIDLDLPTPEEDRVNNLQIPKDWPFDMKALRFQFFVEGRSINKNRRDKIKAMENS